VFNDSVPRGTVVSVSPSDKARKFSTVTITPSKGPEFVTVPDIPVGTPASDAQKQLDDLGLVADFQQIGNRPDPVVYAVPEAGQKVHAGSHVKVIVV
jgi:beta-lactam-binding protein with PASTA domain